MDKLALTFQSSTYLWGLLALAIPVAIHLLSKHKGKVVPFSHIALIQVKNSPQLNQARLTQWLLLILRLLMLLVACGILAQLFWDKNTDTSADLVLVSNDWLAQSSGVEKQQLFENLNSNPRLFLIDGLNQSLSQRKLKPKQVLAFKTDSSSTTAQQKIQPLNIWANVANIVKTLSEDQKIKVYTTNRLNQFSGQKVAINNPIDWHIKSLPVTPAEIRFSASLMVISDSSHQQQLSYLRGALNALTATLPLDIKIEYLDSKLLAEELDLAKQQSHIIYLADASIPMELVNLTTAIINTEKLQGYTQADFPLTLAAEIFTVPANNWFTENARLSTQQVTQLPDFIAANHESINVAAGHPLHLWLIMILVILFMSERLISEWPSKSITQVEGD